MACCDDCDKQERATGVKTTCAACKSCGCKKAGVAGLQWPGQARVGAYATPEAEDAWRQGVTVGWVGGSATVLGVLAALWIFRGR